MHPCRSSCAALSLLLVISVFTHARQFEPLRLPGSPASYAFGGGASAILTDDPMASIANPAQVGMQAFDNRILTAFAYGSYSTFGGPFQAAALSLGANISPMLGIGIPIALGVSYTTTSLDLGEGVIEPAYDIYPPSLFIIDVTHTWRTFTLSAAVDAGVIVSFGVARNTIDTKYPPDLSPIGNTFSGETFDLGGMVVLPVGRFLRPSVENIAGHGWLPVIDLSMGFARTNLPGDGDIYDVYAKSAAIGTAARLGVDVVVKGRPQSFVMVTISREAYQPLGVPAVLDSVGNIIHPDSYYDGFGQMKIWKNVIVGNDEGRINVRDGFAFSALGVFTWRYGWDRGLNRAINATGYGVSLSGLAALLRRMSDNLASSDLLRLMEEKVGLRYDYCSSQTTIHNFGPSDFYGVTVTYR